VDNLNIENYDKFDIVLELLSDDGFSLNSNVIARIGAHLSLIHAHGSAFGVVSEGDIRRGAHDHVIDSLSFVSYLMPFIDTGMPFVDVGSGGGFPGIVCAAAFPELKVVLIERSAKKCAFLRRCVAELSVQNVSVLDVSFQDYSWDDGPVVVATRGIERADQVVPELLSCLSEGSTFFWMTGPKVDIEFGERFHVEQIVDNWTALGVRRGCLYRIEVG